MADKLTKSTGDWEKDQRAGYTAHFNPPVLNEARTEVLTEGSWEGPNDAFVWLGQPFEGIPYSNEEMDPISGKMVPCRTFLDPKKYSSMIDSEPVKWIAWDGATGCNVYKRTSEVELDENPILSEEKRGPGRPKVNS